MTKKTSNNIQFAKLSSTKLPYKAMLMGSSFGFALIFFVDMGFYIYQQYSLYGILLRAVASLLFSILGSMLALKFKTTVVTKNIFIGFCFLFSSLVLLFASLISFDDPFINFSNNTGAFVILAITVMFLSISFFYFFRSKKQKNSNP